MYVCLYFSIFHSQQLVTNVTAATNTHMQIGEVIDASFSVLSLPYQRNARRLVFPKNVRSRSGFKVVYIFTLNYSLLEILKTVNICNSF